MSIFYFVCWAADVCRYLFMRLATILASPFYPTALLIGFLVSTWSLRQSNFSHFLGKFFDRVWKDEFSVLIYICLVRRASVDLILTYSLNLNLFHN